MNTTDASTPTAASAARTPGERLVTRCVEVSTELTMVDVQQIIDSPLPDVPLERPPLLASGPTELPDLSAREIVIVSRDAFAVQLARQWVRAEIPRIPQA